MGALNKKFLEHYTQTDLAIKLTETFFYLLADYLKTMSANITPEQKEKLKEIFEEYNQEF